MLPVRQDVIDDGYGPSGPMAREFACALWRMGWDLDPPTEQEVRTGWQDRVHGDHTHRVMVGWRAEEARAEAERQRESEMAACPYVACTCGHHEE